MDSQLFALLRCPRCSGELVDRGKLVECRACQLDFPLVGGIPNLMPDPRLVPASVPIVSGALALVLMAGVRYCWRLALDRRHQYLYAYRAGRWGRI